MDKHLDTQKIVDTRRILELQQAREMVKKIIDDYAQIKEYIADIKGEAMIIKSVAELDTYNEDIKEALEKVYREAEKMSVSEILYTSIVSRWIFETFRDELLSDGDSDERQ